MVKENTVLYKSKVFAVRIVEQYKKINEEKNEKIMSKQMLRCGTSIGANCAEAEYAISENDLLSKLYIALKEAAETLFWLDLLHDSKYLDDTEFSSLWDSCEEIRRMLSSSTKTLAAKLKN